MTPGLRIARAWSAEDGTQSRLAEMINEAIAKERDAGASHQLERVTPQPPPTAERSTVPAAWDLVRADMAARDQEGRRKYGTPLQPHNGRDTLIDAYQEALDLSVYLRTAIYERDGR
jgi:hypothetical protein